MKKNFLLLLGYIFTSLKEKNEYTYIQNCLDSLLHPPAVDIPDEPELNGDDRDESPAVKTADDEEPVVKSADQPRARPSSTVIRAESIAAAASDLDKIMEFIAKQCNAAVDSGESKGMISMAFLKVYTISIF